MLSNIEPGIFAPRMIGERLATRRPFGLPFEMLQKSQFGRQIVGYRTACPNLLESNDFEEVTSLDLMHEFRGFHPARGGRQNRSGARQSMPSINIASCAEVSVTVRRAPPNAATKLCAIDAVW